MYLYGIALNVDFLHWLPHYHFILGADRLLQVQSLNMSSCEKRDRFGLKFAFVICSLQVCREHTIIMYCRCIRYLLVSIH